MSNRKDIPHIYKPLLPLAGLYSTGVWIRNRLFDRGILPVEEFSIPIISVGNLTVGGTGKTPLTEYLIELLSPHKRVAVLSRGYGRKSRGFVIASSHSTASDIGDEPLQIYRKYPTITVAVDSNRRRGIKLFNNKLPLPRLYCLTMLINIAMYAPHCRLFFATTIAPFMPTYHYRQADCANR